MLTLPIKKTAKTPFSIENTFFRHYSVIFAHLLNSVWVKPLQVLFSRIIIFWWGSLFFFFSENYTFNIIGLCMLFLCWFFDLVDGDLARNHDMTSLSWKFLDGNFDAIILNLVILTLTLKFLLQGYDIIFVIGGILALFWTIFSSRMSEYFLNIFSIDCGQWNKSLEAYLKNHTFDTLSIFLYNLMTPRSFIMGLFSNFRYFLLLWILLHQIPIAVLFFSICINFRWIILFTSLGYYYHTKDISMKSIALFEFLKKIER